MQTLTLGPFAVHPDGILRPRAPALRPALRFAWRGRPCEAAMHGPEEGLRITAIAARVPSTAEHGAEHRRAASRRSRTCRPACPRAGGWRSRPTTASGWRRRPRSNRGAPPPRSR
jgi:hypothetical protein